MSQQLVRLIAWLGVAVAGALLFGRRERPRLQSSYERFHEAIKHDEADERAKLREKRDLLLTALRANLPPELRKFEHVPQGSYAMYTGVCPGDGNYDIDVGLVFPGSPRKYPDPVQLKAAVRDALTGGNRKVRIRRSCVTIDYMRDGRPEFHVDLAVYLKRGESSHFLAKGREASEKRFRVWEVSDPVGLVRQIRDSHAGEYERAQFRRCVRYLKKWREEQFEGTWLTSIALTVAGFHWFEPRLVDGDPDDNEALIALVQAMLAQVEEVRTREGPHRRLRVRLPVGVGVDLLRHASRKQMSDLIERLGSLHGALRSASSDDSLEKSLRTLASQFGPAFPRSH